MNLIALAEAGDTAGVLGELGALTPAERADHAAALAARAEAMAAAQGEYTDEQRTAQRMAELGCQVSPEAAADWLLRNDPRYPTYRPYPGDDSGGGRVRTRRTGGPGWSRGSRREAPDGGPGFRLAVRSSGTPAARCRPRTVHQPWLAERRNPPRANSPRRSWAARCWTGCATTTSPRSSSRSPWRDRE